MKLPPQLVDDLHHADGAAARDEGRAQDRARLELGLGVEPAREARVARGVVDDGGLAGLRHPARDALADLHAERGDVLALLAQRQLEGQLLLLLVDHQHRPGLGGDELLDLGHDQLDHLARLQDGVGGLDDVGEDGQPLGGLRSCRPTSSAREVAGLRASGRPRGRPAPRAAAGRRVRQEPRWKSKPSSRGALAATAASGRRERLPTGFAAAAPRAARAGGACPAPGARAPPARPSNPRRSGGARLGRAGEERVGQPLARGASRLRLRAGPLKTATRAMRTASRTPPPRAASARAPRR